jgi:spore coat polysaccharide biosynthesis predicted glycosyltransferase SpsG
VDGYAFDESYHRALKQAGLALTVIDDHGHPAPCAADLIVNQNLYAAPALYPGIPADRLLLGLRNALLRREYRDAPIRQARTGGGPLRILVTMGTGDRPNATLRVLRGLGALAPGRAEVVVLAGSANPHRATWVDAAGSGISVRIEAWVADLTPLLDWADLAISAAGTTTWELARRGVPACLVVLAENQLAVAEAAARAGAAIDLGWHADLDERALARTVEDLAADPSRRNAMSARGQALIDGHGATRVAATIARSTPGELR